MDTDTSSQLEVDCIVTTPGTGYFDPDEDRSRLSEAQALTGHPPPLQNGLDSDYRLHSSILRDGDENRNRPTRLSRAQPLTGHPPPRQNWLDKDDRLDSSIVRDGRLQSGDYRRRIEECTQAKQRATNEIDRLYQMCEDLCNENDKLLAENEQLRAEDRLCRNCKLSLSLPVTESERTLRERDLARQLEDAETQRVQLQYRCKELLDELTRLRGSCDSIGDGQYANSFEDDRGESLSDPKQTESVGNAFRDVDPVKEAVAEGAQNQRGVSEQTEKLAEVEKAKTPSPEDCAIFLADHIRSGNEINTLLRNMNLNGVAIDDLEERHPKDPKERRIDGIRAGIASAKGDRIAFLLTALEKSKLNRQAELLCDKFDIQRPQAPLPTQASRSLSSQKPLQASSPDDFADSPCLEPQSDFETVLEPFLQDPVSIHTVAVELAKERDFTGAQLKEFKDSFPGWKESHRRYLNEKANSRCTMDILNIWAQVEVERRKGIADKAQGIEMLANALRKSKKLDVLEKLKSYLRKGVVGPTLRRDVLLRQILSYNLKMEIIHCLAIEKEPGHNDWRALTEEIGHGKFIPAWEKKSAPAHVVWDVWKTQDNATVGTLYNWAVSKNRLDIAGLLESSNST
ncbi:uncharacterized protein LOC121426062 isoform X1 [Lytechinus variegatus]|uniref:uncharacterized protein LOC121426062 isoform X1 n=1 Tax=Lytechinus variegatus TaxID=7654 RepID=UPI001BB1F2C2|nr:uncharacterized protein LOC121426062 isoform X1 [Lytechinus variegatus]XP_041478139.1 uncharacterized protein LOC121426062 isoform X1 [Lytechinus variegatus]